MEVISREIIKPSSNTSSHLQIYPLSFIDHLCPPNYIPLVFFYQNQSFEPEDGGGTSIFKASEERTKLLKKSLSEVLSMYYPFAGRVKDQVSIDCNDDGVTFIVTHMKHKLSEILKDPSEEFLDPLFPNEMHWKKPGPQGSLVAVQVNHFECGGTAISVCLSHKVAEASSLCHFVKDWASITTKSQVTFPVFNGASLFPIGDLPMFPETDTKIKSNMVSKRFVFDASKIKSLMTMASQGVEIKPTREQAVASLIYKCVVSTLRSSSRVPKQLTTYLNVAVDLRAGMIPQQPEKSIGNLVWGFAVPSPNSPEEEELQELVRKIQKGLSEFWDPFAKGLGKERMMKILELLKATGPSENVFLFNITSWCGSGMYEADFGWGKPTWVTTCGSPPKKDVALLMDARGGEGIEVLVTMDEQDMDLRQWYNGDNDDLNERSEEKEIEEEIEEERLEESKIEEEIQEESLEEESDTEVETKKERSKDDDSSDDDVELVEEVRMPEEWNGFESKPLCFSDIFK
ncbi:stemmadenine O-acetyltransferase-like [Prosopis cineraria]|uniref:stemmadenine O-acetyltransferase-like n=1 Tax=Prosopis cineraria TaxID=364024 RepID=UPI00241012A4|nr:stemmadenine O-acetyltransferase-like [Prosopis cineraria]